MPVLLFFDLSPPGGGSGGNLCSIGPNNFMGGGLVVGVWGRGEHCRVGCGCGVRFVRYAFSQ